MVPRPLPPVAGITIARPGQRMTGTALAWIPWAVNPKSKRSYLNFFFSYRCRKGLNQMSAWAQNCLPSTIQQPHTHTPPRLSNRKNNRFSLCAPIPPQSTIPRGNPIHYVWAMHLFSSHFTTERPLSSWATPESTTETESIEINVFPSWFKFIIHGQWHAIFLNRDSNAKGQCGTTFSSKKQKQKNCSLITHLEFLSVMFWSINNYLKLHYV